MKRLFWNSGHKTWHIAAILVVAVFLCLCILHKIRHAPITIKHWTWDPNRTTAYAHEHFLAGRVYGLTQLLNGAGPHFEPALPPTPPPPVGQRLLELIVRKEGRGQSPATATRTHTPRMSSHTAQCFAVNSVWPATYDKVRHAMRLVNATLWRGGVTYFVSYGSFLGAYRYHSMVPWDDDIDIHADHRHKPEIVARLSALAATPVNQMRFKDTEDTNGHMKLGVACANEQSDNYVDCALQLDVFFIHLTANGNIRVAEHPGEFPAHTIFPLKLRPFMGILFPCPANYAPYYRAFIDSEHDKITRRKLKKLAAKQNVVDTVPKNDTDFCAPNYRDRANMTCVNSLPCDNLNEMYPKVLRRRVYLQTPTTYPVDVGGFKTLLTLIIDLLLEVSVFQNSVLSYFIQVQAHLPDSIKPVPLPSEITTNIADILDKF